MAHTTAELRRGMDVYAADGAYLGVVQALLPGPDPLPPAPGEPPPVAGFHGEASGPAPTVALGNAGPLTQAPANRYATATTSAPSLGLGALVVARWWGLRGRRTIPLDDVLVASLERVIVRPRGAGQAMVQAPQGGDR